MKTTFIYTLSDPETLEIRYVGKSNVPKKRLSDHIYSCKRTITHKNNWIKLILSKGYKPILTIIEEVSINNWQHREKYWIERLKSEGNKLVNLDKGGNGSTRHSYNTIDKLILKHKENPNYNKCKDRHIIIDRDELYQKYIIENMSLNKCASFFNTSKATIFRNISDNNLHKDKKDWISQISSRPKKAVIQYDMSMNFISEYESISEAELKTKSFNITKCCKGGIKSSGGFIWKYKDNI